MLSSQSCAVESTANATFIACAEGFGEKSCPSLTDNPRSFCIKSDFVNGSFGACVCDYFYGYGASSISGCGFNATRQECLSGQSACAANTSFGTYKKIATLVFLCVVLYLWLGAFLDTQLCVRKEGINARATGMCFCSTGLTIMCIIMVCEVGALFNYRHIYLKLRDIFLSALSAAVICDLFTLIVIFFRLLNAVKNLKSTITKTFSGKQIIFLCSCGGGSLGFIIFATAAHLYHLAAAFTILLCLTFGTGFLTGAKRFSDLVSKLDNPGMALRLKAFMKEMGRILIAYVLCGVVFAFASLNSGNLATRKPSLFHLQDVAMRSGYVVLLCFFYTIHKYFMNFDGKRKRSSRKVFSKIAARTKVSSGTTKVTSVQIASSNMLVGGLEMAVITDA